MFKFLIYSLLLITQAIPVIASEVGNYEINPGDVLEIFVWNEEALSREVIVRPDGFISLPLAGEIAAGGHTASEISVAVSLALGNYLNDDPVVSVALRAMEGNLVYVLGKVNRPGVFPVAAQIDVTQALAWAGGLNTFADEKDIQVLRRLPDGTQQALPFNYAGVKSGKRLESNILLQSGDVVIVP
jgi:polysaccharide biosynthesis/export protein